MPYDEQTARLSPLDVFDAAKLKATTKGEKEIVGVILALALCFNDLRDLISAHRLLNEVIPAKPHEESPETGNHNALRNHLLRAQVGVLHELLELIRKRKKILESEDFRKLVSRLSKEGKAAWTSVCTVADGSSANDPDDLLTNALVRIRNNIAFHYDPKALYVGYEATFILSDGERVPFVSRGQELLSSRFYFADAAAETAMYRHESAKALLLGDTVLLKQITIALSQIVTRFIEMKGGSWREWR